MFYLLSFSFCGLPFVCFHLCFSFSNFFLYYTIFHLQAFIPLYSLSCPFSSHLASFTSTLSSFPFLIFLTFPPFHLSFSPIPFSFPALLFLSPFPFSFSFLLTYPYFIFSFFNLSFNSPSLSSNLIYLCLRNLLSTYAPFQKPVTARKSSTVRFIIYAQEESTEAKNVDKHKHEKTRKRQENNNYMLTTLFQHDNQLININ